MTRGAKIVCLLLAMAACGDEKIHHRARTSTAETAAVMAVAEGTSMPAAGVIPTRVA